MSYFSYLGRIDDAIAKYQQALAWNAKDETILSNLSQAYLMVQNWQSAQDFAEKCIQEKPEWPKGHYRLGRVFMELDKFRDAADAFERGLEKDPENVDLKRAYAEAMHLFQKLGNKDPGFDPRTVGILMAIQKSSWDVAYWYKRLPKAKQMTLDELNTLVQPYLVSNDFSREVEKIMQLKYPLFKRWMSPLDMNARAKSLFLALENPLPVAEYILPFEPLLTGSLLLALLKMAKPSVDYNLVFTFDASADAMKSEHLNPFISAHGKYATVVAPNEELIIDYMSLWASLMDGIPQSYFEDFINEKLLHRKEGWIYSISEYDLYNECLEAVYSRDRKKALAIDSIKSQILKSDEMLNQTSILGRKEEEESNDEKEEKETPKKGPIYIQSLSGILPTALGIAIFPIAFLILWNIGLYFVMPKA